jgi:hypothetical protein
MGRSIEEIEALLGVKLPTRHRAALLNSNDPIHRYSDLLTPDEDDLGSLVEVNHWLLEQAWRQWPAHLVAFATNGCGDYFVYDTRTEPHRILYIGPDGTAPELVAACEQEGSYFRTSTPGISTRSGATPPRKPLTSSPR